MRRIARGLYGVAGMRPWIVTSVVLSFALACTFDSTGIDTTTAVASPGTDPAGSEGTTQAAQATEPNPSGDPTSVSAGDSDADSESTTDEGTASASGATTPGPMCGNGAIDAGEACDGAELAGASCQSLGHAEGTLLCSEQCQYDEQQCSSPSCGDGEIDANEACDCGAGECTAPQLNNQSCSSLPAPQGGNFGGGTLKCASPGPCTYDTAECTYCGDGAKNGAEVCDGADLGGKTCENSGFHGGTMGCTNMCTPDPSGCTNCGNGQINQGEACDGANINGKTCKSIDDSKYNGGTPTCNADCGGFTAENCNAGNCCVASNMGGTCSLGLIRLCVCALKLSCCQSKWDSSCVDLATDVCGAEC